MLLRLSSVIVYGEDSRAFASIISTRGIYGYDAENHLVGYTSSSVTASFLYDGDGRRVMGTINGTVTVYIGGYYEDTPGAGTKSYFSLGSARVAVRDNVTGVPPAGLSGLTWLLADHLGSQHVAVDAALLTQAAGVLRYTPWGETRANDGATPTTFRYTGQSKVAFIK